MDARVLAAPGWYLFDGRDRHGPMPAGQLTTALLQLPNPRRGLVWSEVLPAWTEAGAIPELASLLPPQSPAPQSTSAPPPETPADSVDELAKTAALYRRLVLLVGALILFAFVTAFVAAMLPPILAGSLRLLGRLGVLALFILMSTVVYRLASRIEVNQPMLWAFATCVPLVNLVALAMLSREAQAWCARHGVAVGLLGPPRGSLDWMRDDG